jgi:DNA-binding MarR family transcriptional regulator
MEKAPSKPASSLWTLPCACANLRRAARTVTQLYSREMKKTGLEPAQFGLLLALSSGGEITQGYMAERLAIDSTTLTRTLAPLRAQGWIASKPGADRRERLWRLTPAGRRKFQQARSHWERAQRRLRAKLGEENWESLQTVSFQAAEAAQAVQM